MLLSTSIFTSDVDFLLALNNPKDRLSIGSNNLLVFASKNFDKFKFLESVKKVFIDTYQQRIEQGMLIILHSLIKIKRKGDKISYDEFYKLFWDNINLALENKNFKTNLNFVRKITAETPIIELLDHNKKVEFIQKYSGSPELAEEEFNNISIKISDYLEIDKTKNKLNYFNKLMQNKDKFLKLTFPDNKVLKDLDDDFIVVKEFLAVKESISNRRKVGFATSDGNVKKILNESRKISNSNFEIYFFNEKNFIKID